MTDARVEADLLATSAVERARAAAADEAADDRQDDTTSVGAHLDSVTEDTTSVTHYFAAELGGYRGWRWAVTLAGSPEGPVTVSEVVLLPGPEAMVAPVWVPWDERVRPGDLGVGDLLPAPEDDPRLVPGYLASDDPAIEETAREVGLGRVQVLSRLGRDEAAARWQDGARGPGSDMAKAAAGACGTCGFLLPLGGALRSAFGVCANAYAPADGEVVAVGFGCGAHSDVHAEASSAVPVAALVYDDGVDLDTVE